MKPRVLFAAVELDQATTLPDRLAAAGYRVDVADNERTLLILAGLQDYDAIILDAATPAPGHVATVQLLRRKRITVPILMLSARSTVTDRVTGLDAGADDYLSMPVSISELLARLRALLRRRRPPAPTVLRVADLEIDLVTQRARRGTERIQLAPREFALLEMLMSASPNPLDKAAIIDQLWRNRPPPHGNALNVLVNAIRRKIHRKDRPRLLHTVRGVGFSCRALV